MPVHIPQGSVFLLLLTLSCYRVEIIFQLCFSVLIRLSRRDVASLHDELSAPSTAGGGRGQPVEGADRTGQLTIQTSAGHHELYLSLRTNSTVPDYFSELESGILWSTASKSSRGSTLLCIITFCLFFNKWEIKYRELQDWAAEPVLPTVLRLTADREGGLMCVFGYNSALPDLTCYHFPESISHLSCASVLLADSRNNCIFWKTTGAVPAGTFAHIPLPCVNSCPSRSKPFSHYRLHGSRGLDPCAWVKWVPDLCRDTHFPMEMKILKFLCSVQKDFTPIRLPLIICICQWYRKLTSKEFWKIL